MPSQVSSVTGDVENLSDPSAHVSQRPEADTPVQLRPETASIWPQTVLCELLYHRECTQMQRAFDSLVGNTIHMQVSNQVSSEVYGKQHITVADDGSVRLPWAGNMRFWQASADDKVYARVYEADDYSVSFRWAEENEVYVEDDGSLRFWRLDDGSLHSWMCPLADEDEIYVAQHHTTVAADGSTRIWWNDADERWVEDDEVLDSAATKDR